MSNVEKIKPIEDGTEIISINGARDLKELQTKYPKMEIIVGKVTPDDKPVPLNLVDMEADRQRIFDAATESVLGQRVEKLEKPVKFPLSAFTFVLGAMASAAVCLLMYGSF